MGKSEAVKPNVPTLSEKQMNIHLLDLTVETIPIPDIPDIENRAFEKDMRQLSIKTLAMYGERFDPNESDLIKLDAGSDPYKLACSKKSAIEVIIMESLRKFLSFSESDLLDLDTVSNLLTVCHDQFPKWKTASQHCFTLLKEKVDLPDLKELLYDFAHDYKRYKTHLREYQNTLEMIVNKLGQQIYFRQDVKDFEKEQMFNTATEGNETTVIENPNFKDRFAEFVATPLKASTPNPTENFQLESKHVPRMATNFAEHNLGVRSNSIHESRVK